MARIRSIKPEFWSSPTIAKLSLAARLLFIALWNLADDKGRAKCLKREIAGFAFPMDDDIEVGPLLDELTALNLIHRYTAEGREYLHIVSWFEHQVINRPSKITIQDPPCCPGDGKQEALTEPSDQTEEALTESFTETLTSDSVIGTRNLEPGTGSNPPLPPEGASEPTPEPEQPKGGPRRFDEFWAAYPKRKSRGQAEKVWAKLKPSDELIDRILASVEAAKRSSDWRKDGGQFIPHPATWLNAKGWEDEFEVTRPTPAALALPEGLPPEAAARRTRIAYLQAETERLKEADPFDPRRFPLENELRDLIADDARWMARQRDAGLGVAS